MAIEDLPRRDRTVKPKSELPLESIGSLLVLAGFGVGIAAMVIDFGSREVTTIASIGLVVVGLVLAIGGKKR